MSRPVAITGTGAVTPAGTGARALHDHWMAGRSTVVDGISACEGFAPEPWLTRREIRRTPRFAQMTLVATAEALAEAGWGDEPPCDPQRVGCAIGTAIAAVTTVEAHIEAYRLRGTQGTPPLQIVSALGNAAAVGVQLRYRIRGESFGVAGACAAGGQAIGAAVRMIRNGEVDAMIVGGADAALSPRVIDSFRVIGALTASGRCRPFDRRRDGLALGEGAGVLVLESAELVRARGARSLGWIVGYGASSDAFHVATPPQDGAGAVAALESALADAGAEPADVGYVNAHGTGTLLNDRMETVALKRVFGAHADALQVSSIKSAIGHLMGGAGAVEAIATLQVLRSGRAGPTVDLAEPDDGLDLDYVPGQARPLTGRRPLAVSNSFGLGGHNSVVVINKGEAAWTRSGQA